MGADAISHRQMLIDLQEAFGFFDNNGEGCISAEEIAMVIRSLDRSPATADDVRAITRELFDEDGNGAVEFQQLLKLLARKKQETDTEEELKEAFKVFDKDQNGFISPSELKQVMINLGERLSDEEVEQMIKEADLDGDGLVNYEEFVNIMTGTPV